MDVRSLMCLWLYFVSRVTIAVTSTVDWVTETSLRDVHCSDRLTTVDANSAHNCAVECYSRAECISIGYSDSQKRCQLYELNLADFSTGLITQDSTTIFRAACPISGYTYVRPLNVCMKLHNDSRNFTSARSVCQSENSQLLVVDAAMMSYLTKLYPYLKGINYLLNGELISATDMYTDVDNPVPVAVQSLIWIVGEPNISNRCITVTQDGSTGVVGLQTWDCSTALEFFCGHPLSP